MKTLKLMTTTVVLLTTVFSHAQTKYTSAQNGNWNTSSTWTSGAVPSGLNYLDTLVIQHNINLDVDYSFHHVMIVMAGDSLTTSSSKKLKPGKDSVDGGVLYNYGYINIEKLENKPKDGITTASNDALPHTYNYGTMILTDLHVGNNDGRGAFFNKPGGKVTVSNQLHLDNYLENEDTITVSTTFKAHGGTVGECGYIITPLIDADPNSGRAANFECIDFCTTSGGSTEPQIDVGSTTYYTLASAYAGANASDATFHQDSTLFCGYNEGGSPVTLPIKLLYFTLSEVDGVLQVEWATTYESQTDYFVLETLETGDEFKEESRIKAKGESTEISRYTLPVSRHLPHTTYFRLKQVDIDGQYAYSQTIAHQPTIINKVVIFPNPTATKVITAKVSRDLLRSQFEIRDLQGKLVSRGIIHNGKTLIPIPQSGFYTLTLKSPGISPQHHSIVVH